MKFKYEWSMLFVTILWANNYVSAKIAMETYGATPNFYTAMRFCLAACILGILFLKKIKKMSFATFKISLCIGGFVGLGYVMQTIGCFLLMAINAPIAIRRSLWLCSEYHGAEHCPAKNSCHDDSNHLCLGASICRCIRLSPAARTSWTKRIIWQPSYNDWHDYHRVYQAKSKKHSLTRCKKRALHDILEILTIALFFYKITHR